jgi:hypothetical protein
MQQGGDDTFKNCIPLCFDCHAEVGHYTDSHPKGIKFTPEELRQHRDRWYAKVQTGLAQGVPADYRQLDTNLLLRLLKVLGGSEQMTHFRDHDYGAIYPAAVDQRLREFLRATGLPENEFFDVEMDGAIADLKAAVEAYNESSLSIVCRHEQMVDHVGIPREWRAGDPVAVERFRNAVKLLNENAAAVWNAYCQFIKTGKQRLNVELNREP